MVKQRNSWWSFIILLVFVVLIGGLMYYGSRLPRLLITQEATPSAQIYEKGLYEATVSEVEYFEDTKGYYATPMRTGTYPGVVMIHEWWGLNENIKDMARLLATNGYRVLAVDLYEGRVATDSSEAQKFVASVNNTEAVKNMKAAVSYLKTQGISKIGSLGWCFGGGKSLALALSGEALDATVLYYGTPLETDPKKLSVIKWPVLGIFGDKDQAIPVETVKKFQKSLTDLGVNNEIYIYEGVGHAFANPTGQNYSPEETKDAWTKTLTFLDKYLSM